MTEAEWLDSSTEDPTRVIERMFNRTGSSDGAMRVSGSERKLRLFACACCVRQTLASIDPRINDALAHADRFADGKCDRELLAQHHALTRPIVQELENRIGRQNYLFCISQAVMGASDARQSQVIVTPYASSPIGTASWYSMVAAGRHIEATDAVREEAQQSEATVQISLLRDIFGNPFRPVSLYPGWRTSNAVAIAQGMYESRDFAPMPLLADALEEGGCQNEAILKHCRTNTSHVRGCWLVDLLLGKS